ncbi:MAG: hypothetical protein O3A95_10450 [Planctomycetota bacterium]|nr:hypothetical protein [Planctomycetota bacterium]MDA1114702.1 hypothetical protein [Planctomycetota bacterium]
MANIATLIKNEIRKETEKAVRDNLRPLLKDLQAERIRVQDLERQVNALTKQINKVGAEKATAPQVRNAFRSSVVGDLRKQHHLSQGSLAGLLGVGLNTVWLWEKGRTRPRVKQQEGLDEIANLSAPQLKRRLTAAGIKEGKSKPGRKPGSTKAVLAAKKAKKKPVKKTSKKRVSAKKVTRKRKTSQK